MFTGARFAIARALGCGSLGQLARSFLGCYIIVETIYSPFFRNFLKLGPVPFFALPVSVPVVPTLVQSSRKRAHVLLDICLYKANIGWHKLVAAWTVGSGTCAPGSPVQPVLRLAGDVHIRRAVSPIPGPTTIIHTLMRPDIYDRGWVVAPRRLRLPVGRFRAVGRLRSVAGGVAALVGVVLWAAAAMLWAAVQQLPPVMVQRCMTPERHLAWVGVHLALLRERPGCATGQLALDAGPGHIVGLVVIIAAPTLLANLFMVLGAVGVGVALRTLLARAADAVRPLWRRIPWRRPVLLPRRRLQPPVADERRPRAWQLDRSPVLRRGPPVPMPL